MKAFLLFVWVLLALVGCNPAGPQFPPGADETYDWGIKYARFGDEWWSVRNGEKWNRVSVTRIAHVYFMVKPGVSLTSTDFGAYSSIVTGMEPDENVGNKWHVYTETGSTDTFMKTMDRAWSTGKVIQIRLHCYKGCDIAL